MFYEPRAGHGLPHDPFKAMIAPRPIAWVSTLSADGIANLAPFSYFNAIGDAPPMLMISFSPRGGPVAEKDTLANILATGEYVVHIVPHALSDAMNVTSAPVGPEVDEFERAGLTKAPSRLVAPPRIAEAPVALECRHRFDVGVPGPEGGRSAHVVFGEVVGVEIAEDVLEDGVLKVERYQPLARLGYRDYARVTETFALSRPKG